MSAIERVKTGSDQQFLQSHETGSAKPRFYFQYPDTGKTRGNKAYKKLGFDISGTGGQVAAPGAIHPDTGQPYTLHNDAEIAPALQWLLDLYGEPVQRSSSDLLYEIAFKMITRRQGGADDEANTVRA